MKSSTIKSINWSLAIAVITLVLAAIFSIISTAMLSGVSWAIGMLIVFAIVLVGVVFDIVGVASTAADETPFHAMASERLNGAKQAIFIVRNADRVASFCNDVIGDISGIVSGTAAAAVVFQLSIQFGHGDGSIFQNVVSIMFTSVVAALTVGGKALGKSFAIHFSTGIIYQVGRLLYFVEQTFKIKITTSKKKRKSK
ncbi:hypothetical protein [Pseudalkalibacillus caeni]|uniref:CNNM transmembrane domain-containing protein n=1 Tax=Exobacillus caeni TaxID=2574798 RepID=A0A5R9F126_9BACL|nr:hypothetical protein [Pseudalkalibacillus caeni]TLS36379.1 hypothetical protein FCL54_15740 [Pseudalkalibacillus caeni]